MKIKEVTVKRFRGLREFTCARFAPVTVIGGSNNCGKSSVLESIFLNACMLRPNACAMLNGKRELGTKAVSDLTSIFYGRDIDQPLSCSISMDDGSHREVQVSTYQPTKVTYHEVPAHLSAVELNTALQGIPYLRQSFELKRPGRKTLSDSCFYAEESKGSFATFSKNFNEYWTCGYLSTRNAVSPRASIGDIFERGDKQILVAAAQEIDKRISDLQVIGKNVFATLQGIKPPIPLELIGDGMVKIIGVISQLYGTKGGTFCVDEIENGLHYSVMEKFWRQLLSFAEKWDVQLIVTTHNMEMLQSITPMLKRVKRDYFSYIKLDRCVDDTVVASPMSASSYTDHISQGIEIR